MDGFQIFYHQKMSKPASWISWERQKKFSTEAQKPQRDHLLPIKRLPNSITKPKDLVAAYNSLYSIYFIPFPASFVPQFVSIRSKFYSGARKVAC
jgi:hypothetical protein